MTYLTTPCSQNFNQHGDMVIGISSACEPLIRNASTWFNELTNSHTKLYTTTPHIVAFEHTHNTTKVALWGHYTLSLEWLLGHLPQAKPHTCMHACARTHTHTPSHITRFLQNHITPLPLFPFAHPGLASLQLPTSLT